MPIVPIGNAQYVGNSGDTRPSTGIVSGARLTEHGQFTIDYYWNGAAWEGAPEAITGPITFGVGASGIRFSGMQMLPNPDIPQSFTVWASGTTYRTLNNLNGIITYSGDNSYLAIQGAISGAQLGFRGNRGINEVFIKDGYYELPIDGSFSGIILSRPISLRMGKNAKIMVPSGYSGDVFQISTIQGDNNSHFIDIEGGYIMESAASWVDIQRTYWTAFHYYTSGSTGIGMGFNKIRNTFTERAGKVVWFETVGGAGAEIGSANFLNGNVFTNNIIYFPTIAYKFNTNSGGGSFRNTFINNYLQSASGHTLAYIDGDNLYGAQNTFVDNTFWDLVGSGTWTMHIGVSGTHTVILGGTLTQGVNDWYHSGVGLKVLDQYVGAYFGSDLTVSGVILTRQIDASGFNTTLKIVNSASGQSSAIRVFSESSGINNASISFLNKDENERLLFQKTTLHDLVTQRISTSGAVRDFRYYINDVPAGTTIEALRITTSGNVEFNRSGGTVQFNSGNTSLTRTETTDMSGAFSPLGFLTVKLGSSNVKVPYFAA